MSDMYKMTSRQEKGVVDEGEQLEMRYTFS